MKKILLLATLATTTATAQKPTNQETPEARLNRIELNLQRFNTRHERGGLFILFGAAAAAVGYVVADPKDRAWVMAPGCGFMLFGAGTVYFAGRQLGKH